MVSKYIRIYDTDEATEHQLKAAIEHNSRTLSLMSHEVNNIKKVNETAKEKGKQQPVVTIEEEILPQSDEELIDQDFEEEVEYYTSEVKRLTAEHLDELSTALPSRKHYEYERILRRIQIELLKDCKDIKDFISLEKTTLTEEFQEFLDELNLDMLKVKAIGEELVRNPDYLEEDTTTENRLIFVPTPDGNIRILSDIDSMDLGQRRKIEQLLNSIKDGTFKNVKRFNNNNNVDGLTEVRDIPSGGRVTFMRLDTNTYAIISAFIKKVTNGKGYQKMLANQFQSYHDAESQLKDNLTNPEFLEIQEEYEQELFEKLNPTSINMSDNNNKATKKQKSKADDNKKNKAGDQCANNN